jgi:serine/threonine-protein kinase
MPSMAASGQVVPANARSFGKYQLIVKLATGGMAEIFLARLKGVAGFEKFVVIKRILPHLADEPQFVGMFLDEARIAARISHANVCQVHELGEVDHQYFLSMEYLEGVTLNSAMRKLSRERRLMDVRLATGIAVQAAEGLHHAHELCDPEGRPLGIVHRDVSPQNLFVTVDGLCKVLDFGIAKAAGASTKTRTGTVKGKYAYMPPEQLKGEILDRRVDVFALGVVMFEALTGKRLFWRETDFLIFRAIAEEPIPRVRDYRPDVPAAIDAAVARALARDRNERFPTARAFGEALAQALQPLGGPLAQTAIGQELRALFQEELDGHRRLVARALGEPEAVGSSPEDDTLRTPGGGPLPIALVAGADGGASNRALPRAATPPPGTASDPARRSMAGLLPLAPPEDDDAGAQAGISAEAEAALARSLVPTASVGPSPTPAPTPTPLASASGDILPVPISTQSLMLGPKRSRGRTWLGLGAIAFGGVILFLITSRGGTTGDELQSTSSLAGAAAGGARTEPVIPSAASGHDEVGPAAAGPPREDPPATKAPGAQADPPAPEVATSAPEASDPTSPTVGPGVKPSTKPQRPRRPRPERNDGAPPDSDGGASGGGSGGSGGGSGGDRPPPPADTTPGTISLDSDPYATIYIDGKKIGITPLAHISLSPGTHKVRAVSALGEKTITITIEPGKPAKGRKLTW